MSPDWEKLIEAGNALADALRSMDSYATVAQTAPLECSDRAIKALIEWRVALEQVSRPHLAALPAEPEQEKPAIDDDGTTWENPVGEPVRATGSVRAAAEALVETLQRARYSSDPTVALSFVPGRARVYEAMGSLIAVLAADREPEPPTVPMLRDGNGWVDPYVKLRQRDAELEELCDEIDRLKANPVRAAAEDAHHHMQTLAGQLRLVARFTEEGRHRLADDLSASCARIRAALAADREPERVEKALGILRGLVEGENAPCSFDHHGYCQEHDWMGDTPGECGVREARQILGLSEPHPEGS